MFYLGFEISDVLAINDKDYSITFGLYFIVEWVEPRLNLSNELWGEEVVGSSSVGRLFFHLPFIFLTFSFQTL